MTKEGLNKEDSEREIQRKVREKEKEERGEWVEEKEDLEGEEQESIKGG